MEKTSSKYKELETYISSNNKGQREFSAGGVVYRKSKNQKPKILWLVAKSAPSELYPRGFWRLPKGWLDDENKGKGPGPFARGEKKASEENLQNSALREVSEEGGIEARVVRKIETERYFFTLQGRKILKFVTFYLMEWLEDLPEGPGFETSEIAWLPFEEARKKLKHSGEKKILDKAKEAVYSGVQENIFAS